MSANSDEIIQRDSLFKSLDENSSKKVIAIIAPAGYGKTTLIRSYLAVRKYSYIWLSNLAGNNSFISFIKNLISSFKILKPEFGNEIIDSVSAVMNSTELNKKIDDTAIDLLNQFIENFGKFFKNKLILIIDDFHLLDPKNNKAAIVFIENLVKSLPENLNLIITSRTEPDIGINRLKAKREIFLLTANELKFTKKEILELTEKIYPDNSNTDLIDQIDQLLNGWITGIHLVLQSGNKSSFKYDNLVNVINESLYEFFIEEIWQQLEKPVKEFLLSTSHFTYFTPKLCLDIFGITNAFEIIDILLKKNIFIIKNIIVLQDKPEDIYTYNEYFKRFLQNQQSKTLPKDDLVKSIRKIAEYYQYKGDYDNAISCFLQAERFDEALKLISDIYGNLSQIGDLQKIDNWFTKLPEELILKYPDTAYLQAFLVLKLNNDLKKTSILINAALNSVMDVKLKIKFTLLKAELFFKQTEMEQICTELSLFENTIADADLLIQLNYVLGKVLYRMGSINLKKAKKRFETALKILDENDKDIFRSEIFMYLGNIYQDLGEFDKSLFYRKRSAELSINVYQKMQVYSNLAGLYIHMGQFSETYTILEEMRSLYKSYQFRSLKRFLIKTEANFYYECGDHEACFQRYDELIKIENSVNISVFMWHNYLMVGLQQYYTYMPSNALQYFDIAETSIKSGNIFEKLLIDQGRALCLLQINAVKNKNVVEYNLTAIYDYYKLNNFTVVQAQVSFYLAVFYLRNDQFETALTFLKTALDPKQQKELISFLERELPIHRDIMDFAVSNNINKPLVQFIYDKSRNREAYTWLSKDCLKRFAIEKDIITDIKFKPFGKTELFLRGNLIPDDKWIRKKSKILLAYLMCDPEKIHTKDKIMDLFFDDLPADKADVVYHSAIYNIRTALKIYDIKSDKPKRSKDKTFDYNPQYILYEDKTLRLNPDFYYTSESAEFEKHYNKTRLPALSSEEKITHSIKAIEMYKGDFLPGYYDSWCEELRVKYKNMYITLCEELIKILETEIRFEEVIKYSELLLKEDKLNDLTHISIINGYAKLGNIKMAKSRYEIMLKIYNDELGEKPQPKTLSKINSILAGK